MQQEGTFLHTAKNVPVLKTQAPRIKSSHSLFSSVPSPAPEPQDAAKRKKLELAKWYLEMTAGVGAAQPALQLHVGRKRARGGVVLERK